MNYNTLQHLELKWDCFSRIDEVRDVKLQLAIPNFKNSLCRVCMHILIKFFRTELKPPHQCAEKRETILN